MHPYLKAKSPSILAHRGGSLETSENTLQGFEYAINLGAEYIETDVQLSKDGIPYIFHDDDLKRICKKNITFNQLNGNEIDLIKIFNGCNIPTLQECLDVFPDTKFNIDLKTDEVVVPALKILSNMKTEDRVCIASFANERLEFTRENYPKFCTSMGPKEILNLKLSSLGISSPKVSGNCVQIPIYKYAIKLVTNRLIRLSHKLGLKVHVWTINDPNIMQKLIDMDIDGIITDKPKLLREIIQGLN